MGHGLLEDVEGGEAADAAAVETEEAEVLFGHLGGMVVDVDGAWERRKPTWFG